jgi:hypothetical protein
MAGSSILRKGIAEKRKINSANFLAFKKLFGYYRQTFQQEDHGNDLSVGKIQYGACLPNKGNFVISLRDF